MIKRKKKMTEENPLEGPNSSDVDFSVKGEFKEDPVPPAGPYRGVISDVKWNADDYAIIWVFRLVGNEGMCVQLNSSGEFEPSDKPIDGSFLPLKSQFPTKDDEGKQTKDGRPMRQFRINMLGKLAQALQIEIDTPSQIRQAVVDGIWRDIPVTLTVEHDEYEGRKLVKVNPFKVKRLIEQ